MLVMVKTAGSLPPGTATGTMMTATRDSSLFVKFTKSNVRCRQILTKTGLLLASVKKDGPNTPRLVNVFFYSSTRLGMLLESWPGH